MQEKRVSMFLDQAYYPTNLEAYRLLKTQIKLLKGYKPLKTVLITSSGPGEGKSTVTANLGLSLAKDGANILLIDGDLRFPNLHKFFGVDSSPGLTDVIVKIYSRDISSGALGKQGLGDLLQFIKFQEKSGWLNIHNGEQTFRLVFEGGELTDVIWENRPVEKRLGARLLTEGLITKNQLTEALQRQGEKPHALGYILNQMGYIEPPLLGPILRSHLLESLQKVFQVDDANFAFHRPESQDARRRQLNYSDIGNLLSKEAQDLIEMDQPFTEEKINSFIRETKIKNIKLFTSGSPTSNSSELLSSGRMKSMVGILSKRFDFILFDSPPAGACADASILGSFLDGVIFVVQAGRFSIPMIQQAKDELIKVQANIIGVVINQFDTKRDGSYQYYYYQSSEKDRI